MDIQKKSVLETLQALKAIDAHDLQKQRQSSQKMTYSWNSFAKKDFTKRASGEALEPPTFKVENSEPHPFIIGTRKYQSTKSGSKEDNEPYPFILGTSRYHSTERESHKMVRFGVKGELQTKQSDFEKGLREEGSSKTLLDPQFLRLEKSHFHEEKSQMIEMGTMETKVIKNADLESNSCHLNDFYNKKGVSTAMEEARQKDLACVDVETTSPSIHMEFHGHVMNRVSAESKTQLSKLTSDDELIMKIHMDVNSLHHKHPDVRYEALLSIHRIVLGDLPGEVNLHPKEADRSERQEMPSLGKGMFESAEKFVECVKETVTKSLLRKFADPSEKCRLLSISLLHSLLKHSPPTIVALMAYIFPVMIERLPIKSLPDEDTSGKIEVVLVELSEEVRLALLQFLHSLLMYSKKKIKYFASEVASILTAAAMDSHPENLLETFAIMTLFGELCKQKLKPVAKQLISALLHSLSHNRHRVRVAALKAIHRLVLCGAHESIYDLTAYRDPNLVPIRAFYQPCPKTQYLALLANDRSVHVREQLLITIASWLRELWERKEHECRLVPYILTGFTDENPQIQDLAFRLLEEIGHQYEEENPKEVEDIQEYLREDIDDIFVDRRKMLPRAFKSRPCLGARIMVRSCLSTILRALGGDLEAWTSGTKSLAADFLYTVLIFAEENITMHLQALVGIMQKAFKEPLVEMQIGRCAHVLGFFTDPTAYLKAVLPLVSGEMNVDVSVSQLGANLKMLAAIMQGTRSSSLLTKHIPELCSLLTAPEFLTSVQLAVNEGILDVVKEMVRAYSREESQEELTPLLWLLLNAAASCDFCNRSASKAERTLEDLAVAARGVGTSNGALVAERANEILDLLPHPAFWNLRSLDVLVFCRVLHQAPLIHTDTYPRLFRLVVFFGRGSVDMELKQRLLRAIRRMTASLKLSDREDFTTCLQEHMVKVLDGFFVPCLEDPSLKRPALVALLEILAHESCTTMAVPSSLAAAVEQLQCTSPKDEPSESVQALDNTSSGGRNCWPDERDRDQLCQQTTGSDLENKTACNETTMSSPLEIVNKVMDPTAGDLEVRFPDKTNPKIHLESLDGHDMPDKNETVESPSEQVHKDKDSNHDVRKNLEGKSFKKTLSNRNSKLKPHTGSKSEQDLVQEILKNLRSRPSILQDSHTVGSAQTSIGDGRPI